MNRIIKFWEIEKKWQLLFPITGIISLVYIAYLLTNKIIEPVTPSSFIILTKVVLTSVISYLTYKIMGVAIEKLSHRWNVNYKWEVIAILMVFSITGSSSIFIGKPFLNFIGVTKEHLNVFVYYPLFIIFSFMCYQLLLVMYGWLFGQFKFFWTMEKKILSRFGIKI
ncbi:DUF6787 family protein [Aquimarina sp. 2201CG5-10]|uniref:DUF6787 family protein n=1 Tax=Aquimarina callyspongiae TaxID=3098150 RepID=UPI002AB4984E|nr:DUF6787 family protein [Aquimarina sp. 2201CG5-10]MDY8137988.1 DUF6787 family protein [Aquimarina sp. 2201CG5-10]